LKKDTELNMDDRKSDGLRFQMESAAAEASRRARKLDKFSALA